MSQKQSRLPLSRVASQKTVYLLRCSVLQTQAQRNNWLFLPATILLLAATAQAQQTIFNVPSADVLDKGHVYVEVDSSFRLSEPRFSSFVPRVVVGAGYRVELGVNVTGNVQPGPDTTTLVLSFKWKPYDNKGSGYSVLVGNNVHVRLRNRTYDAGDHAYATLVKTFANQARLSGGAYVFTRGVVDGAAHRAGGQFTAEYLFTPRFALAADWYTGKHALGYLTAGAISKPHPKVTLYTAYSIGNSGVSSGNHYFVVQLGYSLRP